MRKKFLFFVVWLAFLAVGPITILQHQQLKSFFANQAIFINLLQRLVGLLAFTLIFIQIILGAFMQKWIDKFGGWILSFHIFEGILIYLLVFSHPFLFVLFNYKIKGVFDPFYVYTQVCLLCKNNQEVLYTLGRFSFWLLTISISAAWFRTSPYLRIHWRKFHIVNYLVFFLIAIHSWSVGSDTHSKPFYWLFWSAVSIVALTVLYKTYRIILSLRK